MRLFHYTSAKHALSALRDRRLKIARISDLNDPFEMLCADMRDEKARRAFREVKKRLSSKCGYLCFSRGWRNLLMWSHYADKHKGAVLEVEIADDDAMPVTYQKSRVMLDTRKIMASGGFKGKHVDMIATTKSKHWEYEREVRVAAPLEDDTRDKKGNYFCSVDIKGVVIGEFSELSLDEIRDALQPGHSVRVTHARLAFRSFALVRRRDKPIATITGVRR
jgi:Protein of unknown function (DUF2971)